MTDHMTRAHRLPQRDLVALPWHTASLLPAPGQSLGKPLWNRACRLIASQTALRDPFLLRRNPRLHTHTNSSRSSSAYPGCTGVRWLPHQAFAQVGEVSLAGLRAAAWPGRAHTPATHKPTRARQGPAPLLDSTVSILFTITLEK